MRGALLSVVWAIGADAGMLADNTAFKACIATPSSCLSLHLSNLGLTGEIPASLGDATKLTDLRLDHNQLTGLIPAELAALTDLTALSLAHNELAGILPEELSGKLVHFSAAHNKLSGPISAAQWAAWTKLETLELENNSLSGSLPGAIGQAVNLNRLSLAHNYFDGPLPAQLGQLAKLKELYLYMNLFTGVIPDALDALNLTKCELTAPADLVGPEAANKPFNIFTQPVPPNIASACTVVAAPPFHLPSGTIPATCWMCLHHRCSAFGDNKCAHVKHILDPRGAGRQMCMCACCASQCNAFREPGVCWPGQNGAVAKASGKSGSSSGSDAPFAIQTHSLPDSMLAEEQQAPAVSGVRAPVLAIGVVVLGVGVLVRRMYAASRGSAAAATPIA